MDIRRLIRSPEKVGELLQEMDGALYPLEECRIHIPVRFAERGLASIGAETYVIGILPLIFGEFYSIIMVDALIRIEPTEVNRVTIEETEYYEFVFAPGSEMIPNLNLAMVDTVTYRIYDEIIAKARVPWYLNYFDLAKIFDTAPAYAGANIGRNKEVTELLISIVARDQRRRTDYYRRVIHGPTELESNPPVYASLNDVSLSATNAVAKLGGGHFRDGTVSALVSPSERPEPLEQLLFQ